MEGQPYAKRMAAHVSDISHVTCISEFNKDNFNNSFLGQRLHIFLIL